MGDQSVISFVPNMASIPPLFYSVFMSVSSAWDLSATSEYVTSTLFHHSQ